MFGRDLIAHCVELPAFMLTHAEYCSINVPQMKNFKVNTQKTSKAFTVKSREFFQNLDEKQAGWKCFAVAGAVACIVIVLLILLLAYKIN